MTSVRSCFCRCGTIHRFWWVVRILALGAIGLAACGTPTPSSSVRQPSAPTRPLSQPSGLARCVGFEDLSPKTTYQVGDAFVDSGATMVVLKFQWSNKQWTSEGRTDVRATTLAGGSGNEMFLNNVNLGFGVGDLGCLTLRFRDKGGNLNLWINDDKQNANFQDFKDVNGSTIGGVTVSVLDFAPDENRGTLRLSGKFVPFKFLEEQVISFGIGGQELYIDDVCPCR